MDEMISIIVPVFNAQRYLAPLAADLCAQTYRNLELLFIDDGSTDRSGILLEKLAARDPRVSVIRQAHLGTAAARNTGISRAAGTYVMFVDDDDRVPKGYVREYADAMRRMPSDVIIGGYRRVAEDGRILFTRRLVRRDVPGKDVSDGDDWLRYILVTPWGKIFRRSFLQEHGICFHSFLYGEDLCFLMQLFAAHPRVSYSRSVSYCWVSRRGSVTNTLHSSINGLVDIFPVLEKAVCLHPEKDAYFCYFLERHCAYHILTAGRNTGPKSLEREFRKCGEWLKANGCQHAMSSFSPALRGELMRDRLAVAGIRMVRRLGMEGMFAQLYAKGRI